MNRTAHALQYPGRVSKYLAATLVRWFVVVYNSLLDFRSRRLLMTSGSGIFDEVIERSIKRTDINDHLATLFVESLSVRPSLIVELGVFNGESTFVFERVARICNARLVSVDVEDCSGVCSWPGWTFVKSDDIAFAKQFPEWCRDRHVEPLIDILFIDTSHQYEHTIQELTHWLPFVSDRGKVFLHDTNFYDTKVAKMFVRKDGSIGIGGYKDWTEQRSVIAALETYFHVRFDERRDFTSLAGGWAIKHHANCAGLTILEKLSAVAVPVVPVRSESCVSSRGSR